MSANFTEDIADALGEQNKILRQIAKTLTILADIKRIEVQDK